MFEMIVLAFGLIAGAYYIISTVLGGIFYGNG